MTSKWMTYYNSIQKSCPYSSWLFRNGKILHVPFRTFSKIRENSGILTPMKTYCIVYEDVPGDPDTLDSWCQKNNATDKICVYYFSHPEHSPLGNAAPKPVIIQQRRDILDLARQGVFDSLLHQDDINIDVNIRRYQETGKIPLKRGVHRHKNKDKDSECED